MMGMFSGMKKFPGVLKGLMQILVYLYHYEPGKYYH